MDYYKEYKSFINSYYLSEGVRITSGILLPAIAWNYFGQLSTGIMMSTGAMCVSVADNAGPIHHRRNGMMACNALIFLVSGLTGFAGNSAFWLGVLLFLFCFLFSMISLYGNRASSIGISGLLVMVLVMDRREHTAQVFQNSLLILSGGVWYMLLSMVLYGFRPFRLARQALGDCIQSVSGYLLTKTDLYEMTVEYEKTFHSLLERQIEVQEKQDLVRELLFKSRDIVKESTPTGRTLVMIFLDAVDLFERVMTSQPDYKALHLAFDHTGMMERFRVLLREIAQEVDQIGIAVKSGRPVEKNPVLLKSIQLLKSDFAQLRDQERTAANVEQFISLRNTLDVMEDLGERIQDLYGYTEFDVLSGKVPVAPQVDYRQFVTHQDMDPKLLLDHIHLQSHIFRHSIRVCMATLAGYIVSRFFPIGHGYWTLLTIIVILKPAYGLTKKRNYQRLLGTGAGALIGLAVLYFVREKNAVFVCMIICMVGAYSFMRTRYLFFVLLLTPYILFLFYLLNPHDFNSILKDRVIDTAIGSGIAFLASIFILPVWEHEQIREYMIRSVVANGRYFTDAAAVLNGDTPSITRFKLSRKQAFLTLANLSDAFTRMLSEPKRKQKNVQWLHPFTVSSHLLTAQIASLSYFGRSYAALKYDYDFTGVTRIIRFRLNKVVTILQTGNTESDPLGNKEEFRKLNDRLLLLVDTRKEELEDQLEESPTRILLGGFKPVADQLNLIHKSAVDLEKSALGIARDSM